MVIWISISKMSNIYCIHSFETKRLGRYFSNLFYMLSLTTGTVEVVPLYTPLLPYTPQCLCHTQTYSDKGRPTQGRCHLQMLGNGARLEWYTLNMLLSNKYNISMYFMNHYTMPTDDR